MRVNWFQLLAAAAVCGLGAICWRASAWERRIADADEALAAFGFHASLGEYQTVERSMQFASRLPWFDGLFNEVRQRRVTAEYWERKHIDADPDPEIMFVAANSAFRESLHGSDRQAIITRLDEVIQKYGEVLKHNPQHFDAAYDYEYAMRLRDLLAKTRGPVDDHEPTTIYGEQGKQPEETDMNQFKMLVPMEPEERSLGPREAGKGQKKVRKG